MQRVKDNTSAQYLHNSHSPCLKDYTEGNFSKIFKATKTSFTLKEDIKRMPQSVLFKTGFQQNE